MRQWLLCLTLVLCGGSVCRARQDIVIADFEGRDYGNWQVTGTAFGPGPAQGTLVDQMTVSGYRGHGLVDSYFGGDAAVGTLTSPVFRIQRRYINFLIGGGMHPGETCIDLLVGRQVVRTATGPNDRPGGSERLDWHTWDLGDLQGRMARIQIVDRSTGGWGHIDVDEIAMSDERAQMPIRTDVLYDETYRPQFHFSARTNWINDPNGLVFDQGEYHLFFQHNPVGNEWGNMTWGHAISKDLVHWEQIADAIAPDGLGTVYSGSAVVDRQNTAGFQTGSESPLIAIYTAAGDTSPASKGQPFTQCLAYSEDRGRTWSKYSGNPVLPHIVGGNRDPKVIWYEPTHRWIMALYLDGSEYGLFASPDLKTWERLQTLNMPGSDECPDFFAIGVDGEASRRKWIFTGANGRYLIGDFDGTKFTPEAGPFPVDYGANYYAVQTYSDIPASDGRRVQIAWMSGGQFPQMPFNQQMSFPCELTLRNTPEGLRLFRLPVREIESLYAKSSDWKDIDLKPGQNPLSALSGELWDIEVEFELKDASAFGLRLRGETVAYSVKDRTVTCLGRTAPLEPEGDRIRLRVLVDRTSLEVFGNGGRASLTSCFLPAWKNRSLELFTEGGEVRIVSLTAHPLRSAWRR